MHKECRSEHEGQNRDRDSSEANNAAANADRMLGVRMAMSNRVGRSVRSQMTRVEPSSSVAEMAPPRMTARVFLHVFPATTSRTEATQHPVHSGDDSQQITRSCVTAVRDAPPPCYFMVSIGGGPLRRRRPTCESSIRTTVASRLHSAIIGQRQLRRDPDLFHFSPTSPDVFPRCTAMAAAHCQARHRPVTAHAGDMPEFRSWPRLPP